MPSRKEKGSLKEGRGKVKACQVEIEEEKINFS
jgi:hypothetical protein